MAGKAKGCGGDMPAALVRMLTAYLPGGEEVVGDYGALYSDHQPQRNAFGFVVVCLVQEIRCANRRAEAQG
jgi:hypothetical protein